MALRDYLRKEVVRPVGLAAVAVAALAVYLTVDTAGNEANAACLAATERTAALDPFIAGELAAFRLPAGGQLLSELSFENAAGETVTMADFAGQTVLLNFWATWCPPCLAEMPALNELQAEAGSDDFAVVAVSVDIPASADPAGWMAANGIDQLGLYRDRSMGVVNDAKRLVGILGGLPTTLLIDEDNCLLGVIEGPAEWSSPDARRLIDAALTI